METRFNLEGGQQPHRQHKKTEEVKTGLNREKELSSAEILRRSEIAALQKRTVELDRRLIDEVHLQAGDKTHASSINLETWETLALGKEVDNDEVAITGQNAISRRTYKGRKNLSAYVKPQSGEVFYRYDPETLEALRIRRSWDAAQEEFVETSKALPLDYGPLMKRREQDLVKKRQAIADYYDIDQEELHLYEQGIPMRLSVDAGTGLVREYGFSRFNELLNFGAIPLTVLRAESDHHDISSVQEAVIDEEKGSPPSFLTYELYHELRAKGPEHPGAKSLMRLACLDYLLKSNDRHPRNILFNETKQQFYGIDNGICLGLSSAETKVNPIDQREYQKKMSTDKVEFTSNPLEIIQMHDDWVLDEEAYGALASLHSECLPYLEKMSGSPTSLMDEVFSDTTKNNKAIKYCADLFKLIYGHEKVAAHEFLNFVQRLEYLVDHRRPPRLELGRELQDFSRAGSDEF